VIGILAFLFSIVSAVGMNYMETAKLHEAENALQAIKSTMQRYKNDTHIIPMINPSLNNVQRNRALVLALTDPAYGWENASEKPLRAYLREKNGEKYLTDPWGKPYQYFSFMVERSGNYIKREVEASWVLTVWKCWAWDPATDSKTRYISHIVVVMPLDEAILLEPYAETSSFNNVLQPNPNPLPTGPTTGYPTTAPSPAERGSGSSAARGTTSCWRYTATSGAWTRRR